MSRSAGAPGPSPLGTSAQRPPNVVESPPASAENRYGTKAEREPTGNPSPWPDQGGSTVIRKLVTVAAAIGFIVAGASSASATTTTTTTSSWVRASVTHGECTATQVILEGYGNSSHEYQMGDMRMPGHCWVRITQYINGNQGASSYWIWPGPTPVYYDGPGYQDMVCVQDDRVSGQACTSLY